MNMTIPLTVYKKETNVRKRLPFLIQVWYDISKANICSENMFDIMQGGKNYEKYSRYHTGNEKKRES